MLMDMFAKHPLDGRGVYIATTLSSYVGVCVQSAVDPGALPPSCLLQSHGCPYRHTYTLLPTQMPLPLCQLMFLPVMVSLA